MPFDRPTLTSLIERIRDDFDSRLPGADSRLRRGPLAAITRTLAGGFDGAYGALARLFILPDEAENGDLDRWASMFLETPRKPAAPASGAATVTGTNGTLVPAGTILVRADAARYATTADATIAGGTADAPIEAEAAGAAGAMDAGQALTFESPVSGVSANAVVAASGVIGGSDVESDSDLRARLLLRMRSPVRGGAASDYVFWALEVAEVTRAWVYENWNGLGTVKVLFVCDGRADIIPGSGDVTAVAEWIAARRPVCAQVTVAAPTASPLAFDIDLTPDTADVRAAVEASLADLIAREAEPGGTLLISHIREAISAAAGETDHVLNSPSANVTEAAGAITTMGSIAW